jgi:hypothetical protein
MAGITQRVHGGVPRHGGEHTRLDARPQLEGRVLQEGQALTYGLWDQKVKTVVNRCAMR